LDAAGADTVAEAGVAEAGAVTAAGVVTAAGGPTTAAVSAAVVSGAPLVAGVFAVAAGGVDAGVDLAGAGLTDLVLAGTSADARPLPVGAERGAGVPRRVGRVVRRPFCPSEATTSLLPNGVAREAPTERGRR
jgi:hypothetical protein